MLATQNDKTKSFLLFTFHMDSSSASKNVDCNTMVTIESLQQHQEEGDSRTYQRISNFSDDPNACRLWAQNACPYGDKCKFTHSGPGGTIDAKKAKRGACHLWATHSCPYGEKCKFVHDGPGGALEKQPRKPPKCWDYRKKGTCKLGDACPFSHDFVVPTATSETTSEAKESVVMPKRDDAEKDCINWKSKGKCSRKEKGTCPYRHDPVALERLAAKKEAKMNKERLSRDNHDDKGNGQYQGNKNKTKKRKAEQTTN